MSRVRGRDRSRSRDRGGKEKTAFLNIEDQPVPAEWTDGRRGMPVGHVALPSEEYAGHSVDEPTARLMPSVQAHALALNKDGLINNFTVLMPCLLSRDIDYEALDHVLKCSLNYLRSFRPRELMSDHAVATLPPILPAQKPEHKGRKTLLLDLDETLVHCSPSAISGAPPPGLELFIHIAAGSPPMHAHVYLRPYLTQFLRNTSEIFEVIIFTASAAIYADQVCDFLDPDGTMIAHRLYRQHCTEIRNGYFKDLRRCGRSIDDVMLVDNSPLALGMTPDNGISIAGWYGLDYEDTELRDLYNVLLPLAATESNPKCLSQRYGLGSWLEYQRAHLESREQEAQQVFTAQTAGPVTQVLQTSK